MKAVLALLVGAFLVASVRGNANGAPKDACSDMIPQHGVDAQPISTSPYTVKATKGPGGFVTVTISNGPQFKGFFVQARDSKNEAVGTFTAAPNVKLVNCNGPATGATHASPDGKPSVTLTWRPGKTTGPVTFLATIAENGGKFWVGQKSQTLTFP